MTVGRRQYNEAEMLQMQQDAEARVRDMQHRARRTVEETNMAGSLPPQPRNRNWSQNPNMNRNRSQSRRNGPPEPPTPEPVPEEVEAPAEAETAEAAEAAAEAAPAKKSGTIVGDIMAALGLDEDYLLIVGLLLILINQRADTTLILALAYLLI